MFESGTKGYKRRVALRRTVQELKKVIASGEALKETYIERAKKAKAGNAPGSYRVARSGLKTTMMQVARAEQMLTSLELIIQHADFAKLSSSFIKGMNAASRELMRAAASMNFTKAERIFTKTLGRNEAVGIKTDAYLDTAADGFSFAALDAALDAEIDKVIGRFVEMDEEDEFRRKMNAGPVSQAVPQTDAEPASQAVPPSHRPRPQTPAAGGAGTGTSPAGSVPPAELSRPVKLYGAALRPKRLADFRGQPKIVKDLGYWIAAAKQKGEPLPHVMITGSRGLGKSTVAEIIAHETGADAPYELQGDTVKNTDVANAIFARVKRGDILYIDEIHLMPGEVQDSFLKAVDEYK
jgi:hypothetical protein